MRDYTKKYLKACIECCYNKRPTGKQEGCLYVDTDHVPVPFRTLHVDHLGPFIKSKRGNSYVIGISDPFTKFLVVRAVRNTKTAPVLEILNDLSSFFGLPQTIITDRGSTFTAKLFEKYCGDNNIKHIKNAVRTPRANGQVERANGSILSFLRTTTEEPKNWDQHMRELQWTINSQRNTTTGFTPNELLFDFNPVDILQNRVIAALQVENTDNIEIAEKRSIASARAKTEREKWKLRFDSHRRTPTKYDVNDLVVIENIPPSTGESRKLEPIFRGPYVVEKVLERDRYVVADIPGMPRNQRKFSSVFTTDKIKHWCHTSPDLDGVTEEEDDSCSETELGLEGPNVRLGLTRRSARTRKTPALGN